METVSTSIRGTRSLAGMARLSGRPMDFRASGSDGDGVIGVTGAVGVEPASTDIVWHGNRRAGTSRRWGRARGMRSPGVFAVAVAIACGGATPASAGALGAGPQSLASGEPDYAPAAIAACPCSVTKGCVETPDAAQASPSRKLERDGDQERGTDPMNNVYARLVAGEDARTEALADLLERVLAEDRETNSRRFGDFVSRVLLADATGEQEKKGCMRWLDDPSAALSVVTQHRIDAGTLPDMVIFSGSDPICVVEVKIDAQIAENQLEGYGGWLAARAGGRYGPALVLLTAGTPAPPGFTDRGRRSFGVELRSVASWNTAAEWFAGLGLEEDGVNEPLKSLAKEFGEFLKEDTMPTLDDAATARQYLAESQRKLTQAVHDMQAGFGFPKHWQPGKGLAMEAVGIWKYQYPEEDHYANYVYCGLAFKPVDEKDGALRRFAVRSIRERIGRRPESGGHRGRALCVRGHLRDGDGM